MGNQEFGNLQRDLSKKKSLELNNDQGIYSNPTFDTSKYSNQTNPLGSNLYVVDEAYSRMQQDHYRMEYLQNKAREESTKKERKAGGSGTVIKTRPLSEELKRLPGSQPLQKRGVAGLPEDELLSNDYDSESKRINQRELNTSSKKMLKMRNKVMSEAMAKRGGCDAETYRDLSAFMILKNGEEANGALLDNYLGSQKDQMTGEKSDAKRNEAMDTITKMVFSIDVSDINFKSDMDMVKNAARLESIVSCVGAYDRLISKNPEYLDKMDPNLRKAITLRINELRAVVCYYISRKDLLNDENYRASRDSELSLEFDDNSPDTQRALIEKIFNSYVLGRNLTRINRGRGYMQGSVQLYIANERSKELYQTASGLSDPDAQRQYLEKAYTSMDYVSSTF